MANKLVSDDAKRNRPDELDKYIIGQDEAKKSVAIALRNRYRRSSAFRRDAGGNHTEKYFDDGA